MEGILVVDKPAGMTSHDVVDFVRSKLRIRKVGHAGTLDPMATGVLIILIGKATKLSSRLSGENKEYEAVMTLGVISDTGDALGKLRCFSELSRASAGPVSAQPQSVLAPLWEKLFEPSALRCGHFGAPRAEPPAYDVGCAVIAGGELQLKIIREEIEMVFGEFRGEIEQVPPMYSAIKYKGKKLYELARQGKEVERKPRRVLIHKLEIKKIALPNVDFEVSCSKGTYIRTLCEDIGKRLDVGAHLSGLRRVRSGKFTIDEAIKLEEL